MFELFANLFVAASDVVKSEKGATISADDREFEDEEQEQEDNEMKASHRLKKPGHSAKPPSYILDGTLFEIRNILMVKVFEVPMICGNV